MVRMKLQTDFVHCTLALNFYFTKTIDSLIKQQKELAVVSKVIHIRQSHQRLIRDNTARSPLECGSICTVFEMRQESNE
jgi:hypothetical protein